MAASHHLETDEARHSLSFSRAFVSVIRLQKKLNAEKALLDFSLGMKYRLGSSIICVCVRVYVRVCVRACVSQYGSVQEGIWNFKTPIHQ